MTAVQPMALLDRFRPQPHAHADPAARLQIVSELPLDDRDTIGAYARDDSDANVRRAAVGKLLEPGLLGTISRGDGDDSVRAQALDMLRDLALEVFEGTTESQALAAIDELAQTEASAPSAGARVLGQIAKSATRATIAEQAASRVTEVRGLGSIARHAVTDLARRHAFDRLRERGEASELLAVALNAEYKDVAVAAVDLLPNELSQIASRSRNKSAARRAANLLHEMDQRLAREAAEAAEAARLAADAERQRLRAAMSNAIVSPVPSVTDSAQLEAIRRGEPDAAGEVAERARAAAEAQAAERATALAVLANEATAAASLEPLGDASRRLAVVRKRWSELSAGLPVESGIANLVADAESTLRAREQRAREADARARQETLLRLQNLVARVEPLPTRADLSLKAAERALRDVRATLADSPTVPAPDDASGLLARLMVSQEALTLKVNELREADEWQKWANVTLQEQLCAKMEALATVDDPEDVARQVRELQLQWRAAADVPRDKADGLWRRFKTAHDLAWARCEAHFAAQTEMRAEHLAKKLLLCEQAEALAESTQWIQTAEIIKQLQAEWKAIGPVSRGREKDVWDRFRTACDRFFTRRHEDLALRKTVWSENLSTKEALCVRVEALAESTDWDQAAAEIKRLQAQWRTVGPVKKSRSEAIWQRFRAACDRFFERYAHRHEAARAERVAAREAICVALEALTPSTTASVEGEDRAAEASPAASEAPPPSEVLARVRTLVTSWRRELALRGVDVDRARALDTRFATALSGVVASTPSAFVETELDPDANRRRMEGLVRKVEELAKALAGPAGAADAAISPSARLASMLKEALAANTIGGRGEDESRLRAAAADLAHVQAAWSQIGDVPDDVRRPLVDRFQRATRQVSERVGALKSEGTGRTPGASGPPSRPRDTRRPPPRPEGGPEGRRR